MMRRSSVLVFIAYAAGHQVGLDDGRQQPLGRLARANATEEFRTAYRTLARAARNNRLPKGLSRVMTMDLTLLGKYEENQVFHLRQQIDSLKADDVKLQEKLKAAEGKNVKLLSEVTKNDVKPDLDKANKELDDERSKAEQLKNEINKLEEEKQLSNAVAFSRNMPVRDVVVISRMELQQRGTGHERLWERGLQMLEKGLSTRANSGPNNGFCSNLPTAVTQAMKGLRAPLEEEMQKQRELLGLVSEGKDKKDDLMTSPDATDRTMISAITKVEILMSEIGMCEQDNA